MLCIVCCWLGVCRIQSCPSGVLIVCIFGVSIRSLNIFLEMDHPGSGRCLFQRWHASGVGLHLHSFQISYVQVIMAKSELSILCVSCVVATCGTMRVLDAHASMARFLVALLLGQPAGPWPMRPWRVFLCWRLAAFRWVQLAVLLALHLGIWPWGIHVCRLLAGLGRPRRSCETALPPFPRLTCFHFCTDPRGHKHNPDLGIITPPPLATKLRGVQPDGRVNNRSASNYSHAPPP